MKQDARSAATRERLLAAGLEVFTGEGFRRATIQQICSRAGANISAAHYHFGDKQGLYAAVFEYAERRTEAEWPRAATPPGPPAERLRAYITAFLTRLLDPRRPAWMARLLAHEMIEPTPALDRLVRRRMRANHAELSGIISDVLGDAARGELVRLCTLSVVSQCVFYRNSAPIVTRLYPELAAERQIDRIADHVTRFSLTAMQGLREQHAAQRNVAALPRPRRARAATR